MLEWLIDYLKEHGEEIGLAACSGDDDAKTIVAAYQFVSVLPDPCAIGILEAAITRYANRRASEPPQED